MKKTKLLFLTFFLHFSCYAGSELDNIARGIGQLVGWLVIITIAILILKAIFGGNKNDTPKD